MKKNILLFLSFFSLIHSTIFAAQPAAPLTADETKRLSELQATVSVLKPIKDIWAKRSKGDATYLADLKLLSEKAPAAKTQLYHDTVGCTFCKRFANTCKACDPLLCADCKKDWHCGFSAFQDIKWELLKAETPEHARNWQLKVVLEEREKEIQNINRQIAELKLQKMETIMAQRKLLAPDARSTKIQVIKDE